MLGWLAIAKIVGIVAAGFVIIGLIHTFDVSRQNIGRNEQKTFDAPVMSICESVGTNLKPADCAPTLRTGLVAIGANKTLQDDVQVLRRERKECSDKVARLEAINARMEAAKAKRAPADEIKISAIDVETSDLRRALGLPDKGGTCEEQLARSTALWDRVKRQRLRDFPPAGVVAPASSDINIKPPPK